MNESSDALGVAMRRPSAGWYPYPATPGTMRQWNGESWIGEPVAMETSDLGAPEAEIRALWRTGIITAFLMPVVGFVYGVKLASRGDRRGYLVQLISVGAFIVFLVLIVLRARASAPPAP